MLNGQRADGQRSLVCDNHSNNTALTTVTCIHEMHNVTTAAQEVIANVANSIIRTNYKGTKHKHLKDYLSSSTVQLFA